MKTTTAILIVMLCNILLSFAQGTVEAELDTAFHYQFESLKGKHQVIQNK